MSKHATSAVANSPDKPRIPYSVQVLLFVVACLGLLRLGLGLLVSSYLESDALRQSLEQLVSSGLSEESGVAHIQIEGVRSEGVFGARIGKLNLERDQKVVLSLSGRAKIDLLPHLLKGIVHLGGDGVLGSGGKFRWTIETKLGQALAFLRSGQAPKAMGLKGEVDAFDALELVALWPPLGENSRARLLSGRLRLTYSRELSGGDGAVKLAVENTRWQTPSLTKQAFSLPPWNAQIKVIGDSLQTLQPIVIEFPFSPVTFEGQVQMGGANTDASLDLKVGSSGGKIGRMALAKLFSCTKPPEQDHFRVRGPAKRPQCL